MRRILKLFVDGAREVKSSLENIGHGPLATIGSYLFRLQLFGEYVFVCFNHGLVTFVAMGYPGQFGVCDSLSTGLWRLEALDRV